MPSAHDIKIKNKQFKQKGVKKDDDEKNKKNKGFTAAPVVVGFFLVVVIGSSVVELVRSLMTKGRG